MANQPTPLMIQYQAIKAEHPDKVVFFRLGDFYEMFNEDAVEVSRLLNLTLTKRVGSPMCGIPYHASKIYIARLLRLGKKIAVCEQSTAPVKGHDLVERKVAEIITPGTALEDEYLEHSAHNYLAALYAGKEHAGFAYLDVTTGDFFATNWPLSEMEGAFARELGRAIPRELLLPQSLENAPALKHALEAADSLTVSYYPDWHFSPNLAYKKLTAHFQTANLRPFSLTEQSVEVPSAGFLLEYVSKNSNSNLPHVTGIQVYHDSDYVMIDDFSRRNLEITANLRDGTGAFTLFETVNYTKTAMGNRLLREWLLFPLRDCAPILKRQAYISCFTANRKALKEIREKLGTILDIERVGGRIAMDRAHAKDLQALRMSLESWLSVREIISRIPDDLLSFSGIDTAPGKEIIALIKNAILDDPSTSFTEGNLIKDGWSPKLDHYREVQTNFNTILEDYASEERKATGIYSLKIRYNRIIGYYIEVTRGKLTTVPDHFILRRTMINGDRYTTERLQELEEELLTSAQNIADEERRLFFEVRTKLTGFIQFLLQAAEEIAVTDVSASFAHGALLRNWVCPLVDDGATFMVRKGRHPVVESHLPTGEFIPNDTELTSEKTFALITGPNMAGKSTYLRQNALITLLAQTGSFVPASKAHIGVVDRIFCRVGASDNLARGESTFLVEMTETAHILRSATEKSLVIMDEVGRGTSTEDGLSIAWAVSEYLLNVIRCKTFFATHYHELTRIAHPAFKLLCLDVLEREGNVVFLKKIREGAAANSFGIYVARLGGIPDCVITRARELLAHIQSAADAATIRENVNAITTPAAPPVTPGLFSDEEMVIDALLSVNCNEITPLDAFGLVTGWQKTLSGRSA